MKIKSDTNAMIVVGDSRGAYFTNVKEKYKNDIIFTGLIPPDDVGDYFKTLDVGLIPFELNDFTNNALPIKAMEYGLAGANVISTPLDGLKAKSFPFIEFCEIEKFAVSMEQEFDTVKYDFSQLSWEKQSQKLIDYMKRLVNA